MAPFEKLHVDNSTMNGLSNNIINHVRSTKCVLGTHVLSCSFSNLWVLAITANIKLALWGFFSEIFNNVNKSLAFLFVSVCSSQTFLSICFLFFLKTFTLYRGILEAGNVSLDNSP